MVRGSWNVDQEDVNYHELFPKPNETVSMKADRVYEDSYGPTLEYAVNDVSSERNALHDPEVQKRVRTHPGERVLNLDCKYNFSP